MQLATGGGDAFTNLRHVSTFSERGMSISLITLKLVYMEPPCVLDFMVNHHLEHLLIVQDVTIFGNQEFENTVLDAEYTKPKD